MSEAQRRVRIHSISKTTDRRRVLSPPTTDAIASQPQVAGELQSGLSSASLSLGPAPSHIVGTGSILFNR